LPAENLIYFENLALSLEKDKKSFFHGVHKKQDKAKALSCFFWLALLGENPSAGWGRYTNNTKKRRRAGSIFQCFASVIFIIISASGRYAVSVGRAAFAFCPAFQIFNDTRRRA
jgi:hypothetical protein